MVETKLVMKKIIFLLIFFAGVSVSAQDVSWTKVLMDGSRTGCICPSKDNVDEALGTVRNGVYHSPSGKKFKKNSATARAAQVVIAAQPAMAHVKEVIGYSTEVMIKDRPESALSNWFIDVLMDGVEELSGQPVDVGLTNFGGIRIDMPKGEILLDDMKSMFPFRNQLARLTIKGKDLREIFERMASSGRFEVLGGVEIVAEDGKLVKAHVGGAPIKDDKLYTMATISFLLSGGDGLNLSKRAVEVEVYEDVDIIDVMLEHVKKETAAGRPIEYQKDGRVIVR